MRRDLLELALARDDLADLDPAARRLALRDVLVENDRDDLAESLPALADAIDGFGPLTVLMEEDGVTDVLVNAPDDVWVERQGTLMRTSARFEDEDDLRLFIERMLGTAGARVDAAHPVADARLHDGSRIHVILPPIAPKGAVVSIRRWPHAPLTLTDLVGRGALSDEESTRLKHAVDERKTIAISGGTGSGKTTLLNALLGEIEDSQRVVVLEETAELRPRCRHHVSLLTRGDNLEGRGGIDLADLVRASLRMRPDRIIVGEVRGAEALAALAALSVGHAGSFVTVHARSAAHVPERLVGLALLARSGASEDALHRQLTAAFDLFVHLERDRDGRRRVAEICEPDGAH